ncbi:MAG: hypothetical protein PHI64_21570 [Zoogloea sp.]|uniref:hypothetical protein n=1 Tax=Zoogloea sp. TaxID=49181 RepID=UPI002610640D|nr:hypothetical protein [Zoogloea sp.]MDD2991530.1 hypothetical protein [Zoogloea sp.]
MLSKLKLFPILLALPVLAACEYEGAAFIVNGNKDENISLVREQRWFWSSDVDQAVVVSRMPTCMRRHDIKSGVAGSVKMEVFEAGSSLWALKQGKNWYLASTEKCEFQRWTEPPDEPPGRLVGTFSRKNDKLEFIPAEQPAKLIRPAEE